MESFENSRGLCVFVTVCDNPSKCVLNTLQFTHVETGKIPEERVAVIKATNHQGIYHQKNSLNCQKLPNLPQITHLDEACLTNIADMISNEAISIKPDTKILYKN